MEKQFAICTFFDDNYLDCILKVGLSEEEAYKIMDESEVLLKEIESIGLFLPKYPYKYPIEKLLEDYLGQEHIKDFYRYRCESLKDALNISDKKLFDIFQGNCWLVISEIGEM